MSNSSTWRRERIFACRVNHIYKSGRVFDYQTLAKKKKKKKNKKNEFFLGIKKTSAGKLTRGCIEIETGISIRSR